MATYYNGVEITDARNLSGRSLSGRSSVIVAGREVTFSSKPKPITYTFSDTSGSRDPRDACSIGPGNPQINFYGDPSTSIIVGDILYLDVDLTNPVGDGTQYYYNFDTNQYVKFDPGRTGTIIEVGGC